MLDKHTILNNLVISAASIMENKYDFNIIVLEQLIENKPHEVDTIARLNKTSERIHAAITLIREFDGCWV